MSSYTRVVWEEPRDGKSPLPYEMTVPSQWYDADDKVVRLPRCSELRRKNVHKKRENEYPGPDWLTFPARKKITGIASYAHVLLNILLCNDGAEKTAYRAQ